MLGVGFAPSICPQGGVGPLSALLIGARASRIIRQARGELAGRVMAWWCIAVGALGAVTVAPCMVWSVAKAVEL